MIQDGDIPSLYNVLRSQITLGTHICHIYVSKKQQFALVAPFIKDGLEQNHRCIYVTNEGNADNITLQLEKFGVDVEPTLSKGQLLFFYGKDIRANNEYITSNAIIDFWKTTIDTALKDGYNALRVVGEMLWVLNSVKDLKKFIEFEAKFDRMLSERPVIALCLYEENKFPEGLIVAALQTHPLVVHNNKIYQKKYYIPPDLLLRRLDKDLMLLYGLL